MRRGEEKNPFDNRKTFWSIERKKCDRGKKKGGERGKYLAGLFLIETLWAVSIIVALHPCTHPIYMHTFIFTCAYTYRHKPPKLLSLLQSRVDSLSHAAEHRIEQAGADVSSAASSQDPSLSSNQSGSGLSSSEESDGVNDDSTTEGDDDDGTQTEEDGSVSDRMVTLPNGYVSKSPQTASAAAASVEDEEMSEDGPMPMTAAWYSRGIDSDSDPAAPGELTIDDIPHNFSASGLPAGISRHAPPPVISRIREHGGAAAAVASPLVNI